MSLSIASFERLKSHWAISAVGEEKLTRADELVSERLAQNALGNQFTFEFGTGKGEDQLLEQVALAYELAAIDGLEELSRPAGGDDTLRDQTAAAAFRAFDIRRLFPPPPETLERLFSVIQISALAYCGERWSDLRRWYLENPTALEIPSHVDAKWDEQLLYRLFECWARLFRKNGWDDLDRISEIIAGLRDDQKRYETPLLEGDSTAEVRAIALRLAALYHWAKATETLARYMLQGEPSDPFSQIDRHFESAIQAARASGDPQHEVILRWLHAAGRIMVTNSLWWATRGVNSRTPDFVRALTRRDHQAMFEFLPPQRAALVEQGLLDPAKTAIVVDMPTSGGKTLLAEFRIIQALNQFNSDKGWVAYIAPTRALCAQLTRRLRRDFEPVGIRVEQLTAAVEVDAYEEELLSNQEQPFDILVATPEKLSLVIRNARVARPMALIVVDEAHNIENEGRGLRIEFLLATVQRDCPHANFLLLMPYVEGTDAIARWLAQDVNAGQSISLGTTPWKPNERVIGVYRAVVDKSETAGWRLEYETLSNTDKAMHLRGIHKAGDVKPINVPRSSVISQGRQKGFTLQTAAIGCVMSTRGTSVAVTNNIRNVWSMARTAMRELPVLENIPDEVTLVQNFLRTEISTDFELVDMLRHGIGVHHGGLSEDVRSLMEWLAEEGHLKLLCATSTIAQGLNFPVSSVFLASRYYPEQRTNASGRRESVEIQPREFWNLVGRAGRIGQDSVGVVGLAEGSDRNATLAFVSRNMGALVSRLVTQIDELAERGDLSNLSDVLRQSQWEDFRCYIAHLWAEKKSLDSVLLETEQLMRHTYGYTALRNDPTQHEKAEALLAATQSYARQIADMRPGIAEVADSTGFSPEGVAAAMAGISRLERNLHVSDWAPESLFGNGGRMADLFGVMLNVPQLKQQLEEIGGTGIAQKRLADITCDWVRGVGMEDIANEYFRGANETNKTAALTSACRAIYRTIVHNGTWGVSALSRISGIDFDSIPSSDRRKINALPAMIYHGVSSEDAVLMRMNSAPRSVAEALGEKYRDYAGDGDNRYSINKAREFLKQLSTEDWNQARPENAALSGDGYRSVWQVLSGEGIGS